jgi:hypothetical protein
MATLVFTCGHCKRQTADHPSYWRTFRHEEDVLTGSTNIEVAAQCSLCRRVNLLVFTHYLDHDEVGHPWDKSLDDPPEHTLVAKPDVQFPHLYRPIPKGSYHQETLRAWNEAEAVYAIGNAPTASSMAYRRVLELAVKQLDTLQAESSEMLGVRISRLRKAGIVSDELSVLLDAAKAFGNEAAHGARLTAADAEIARDLCEALLRQCFTVPQLLAEAKQQMDEKARKKEALAAKLSGTKAASNP